MIKARNILLFLIFSGEALAQRLDTLQVYFQIDKTEISPQAGKFIDSLINNGILEHAKKIIVLGYGDYLGSNDYNSKLSYTRARNVQDYLTVSGLDARDITLCMGKGKISRNIKGNDGVSADRKVQIIYYGKIDTPAAEKFNDYILRLKDNETIALSNIHFFRGSLRMTPASFPELRMLIDFMVGHPSYRIQLEGHVCCLGPYEGLDEPYDESTLSLKRAECISDSLVAHGVEKNRLKAKGLGNRNPIADPEETNADRELNRRVEVRVLGR